mgnify:FL=1
MREKICLASPNMCGEEMKYIKKAFDTNWIAPLGENVNEFEKTVRNYVGSKGAVAMSSGTAAIHMALKAVGIQENDLVFCSALTFSASANPICYEKGIPILIDSDPKNWNMSPIALRKAFKRYIPKAVICVNLYGQSADYDEICAICDEYGVPLIEDAAESLGATYKGKQTGTFGKYGIFSFNGNKIITTSGGGMLVSDDEERLKKVLYWITQAREPALWYQHTELGFNYRMSNVLAGIGIGQMQALNERIEQKKAIYERYKAGFSDIDYIEMMPVCDYGNPNYWLSCITMNGKSRVNPIMIIKALANENIESRPIWKPMQLQPFYRECMFFSHNENGEMSVSQDIFTRGVCLPSDTNMTVEQQEKIIRIVRGMF